MLASLLTSFASASSQEQAIAEPNAFELPDIIEPAEAEENCYVGRLKDAESDLNTFVFAGSDGTNTMRVYSHPVKYIADDGSVRDISLDIKARLGGGFISADHEIITTFKRKLSDGISLTYNDIAVRLVPQISAGTQPLASLSSDSKKVTYQMSNITSLVYELTYAGFKEDIVVEEYTGQTEYEFTLYTNGLTLCQEYGSYYLADADGNAQATIGDIIVFTADERNNTMGSMTYETVRANQEYILTIHLDADYLADEDTVYPIRIDPTIEINYDNNGAGAIEDVTISPTQTFSGTSGALNIGRIPSGGISRALMRFPNLSLSGIAADQITAATVELRDLMCQGDEDITVECRIYNNSAPSWSESGTTSWSSVGTSYLGALLDSHVISYGEGNVDGEQHRYSFNILTAAKAWANGTQSQAKGLVFKANSTFENQTGDDVKSWYKIFASYNRNNYKPSLSITYTYSGGESFADAETLVLNASNYVNIATANEKKYFKFTPSRTGFYTFESFDIVSGDPRAWLYNSDYSVLSSNDDGAGSSNFRLSYHLVAGYTYYFVAGCIVSSPTICTVKVTTTTVPFSISTTSLSWGGTSTVSCGSEQKAVYYKFIPSVTGEYLFYSFSSNGDPRMWLYDSNMSMMGSNDDGAGNRNFRLSITLAEGRTYYLATGHFGDHYGTYKMAVLLNANIASGVYVLKNIGSAKYMDIDGPSAQEWVHQWTLHSSLQEKWTFNRQSDGSYSIRSEYGEKKYVGVANGSVGVDNIKLYASIDSNTKWKVFTSLSGDLVIEPINYPGKVLYIPDSSTGTKLQLEWLSYSISSRHKWRFEVMSDTPIEGQRWSNWCWVTSARMLTNHYFNVLDARTQNNAVSAVKGSVVNSGGTHTEAICAVSFYRSNNININELNLVGEFGVRFSESTLRQFLNDGHVVYIGRGHYDINNVRHGGHATLIVGYTTISVNGTLQYRYIINDPWPASAPSSWNSPEITTGQIKIRSYQWICNGRNALDSNHADDGIWDRYVVVETDYSDNALSLVYN